MKNVNIKKEFEFLLENDEKTTYSRRFSYNKTANITLMCVVMILLIASDCFFLGAGIIFAYFEKVNKFYKVAIVISFSIKLVIDLIITALWLYFIQENSEKAKNSLLTVTDKSILVTCLHNGVASFCKFSLSEAIVSVKNGLSTVKVTIKQGTKKTCCKLNKSDYSKLKELLD